MPNKLSLANLYKQAKDVVVPRRVLTALLIMMREGQKTGGEDWGHEKVKSILFI